MPGCAAEIIIAALQLQVRIADSCLQQPDEGKAFGTTRAWPLPDLHYSIFKTDGEHLGIL
jgi:hypothetical protein